MHADEVETDVPSSAICSRRNSRSGPTFLQVAWNLLSAETRAVFRVELTLDDGTWARGRGWALSVGLIALPYYQNTNPALVGMSRRAIDEVLASQAGA